MKQAFIILASVFLLVSCNAQTEKTTDNKENIQYEDSIRPKIDYKVDRKYDKEGNLIKYDSTYTYYYSNIDKDALINDSVFSKFNDHFKNNPFSNQNFFDDFFKDDKYLEDDFFKEDFFSEHFRKNQDLMEQMLFRMDSLKNLYFSEEFPIENSSRKSAK